jgi:hypothetical protein
VLTDHDAGAQIVADRSKQPLVAYSSGDTCHQNVVRDVVEEFRQVQVDHDTVTCFNVGWYLAHRHLGAAARSEAEARCREIRIEDRREHLRDGLLNQVLAVCSRSMSLRARQLCPDVKVTLALGYPLPALKAEHGNLDELRLCASRIVCWNWRRNFARRHSATALDQVDVSRHDAPITRHSAYIE